MKTPQPVLGGDLRAHFMKHVQRTSANNIYRVVKPLHVFKKVYYGPNWNSAIANLVIPVGAFVHTSSAAFDARWGYNTRKMRASAAQVHSIARLTRTKKPVEKAHSWHDSSFAYAPGKLVVALPKFDRSPQVCAAGIHFFLNLRDAVEY